MRITITALLGLVIGFALGCVVGFELPSARANREAIQQFHGMDVDDSMAAAVAYRAILDLQAGETEKALKSLAKPIGMYFRFNRTQPLTEDRSNFLAEITGLASTNQIVAAEINRKIE